MEKIDKLEAKLKKQREKLRKECIASDMTAYHAANKADGMPEYVGNTVKPRVVHEHLTQTEYEAIKRRSRELFEDYQDQQDYPVGLTNYQVWVLAKD